VCSGDLQAYATTEFAKKVIPAVAGVVSEYQAQVPSQGLVDDGFGLHDFTSVC
jgi:hypothetical protein